MRVRSSSELNTDGDRIRTFYFRHEFNVSDAAAIDNLLLSLIRDDGAAVYLNGTEVLRDNLAAGARNTTFADRVDNEDEYITALVPANLLVSGTNILAAEVPPGVRHQFRREL